MSKKPPRHSVAPTMRIVDLSVNRIDFRRLVDELQDLDGDQDMIDAHPVIAYRQGTSRHDLDAPGIVYVLDEEGNYDEEEHTAREYLTDPDEPRPVFVCRRLDDPEIAAAEQMGEKSGAIWAFGTSCKSIEGIDGFEYEVGRRAVATEAQGRRVAARFGYDVKLEIGTRIVMGSKPPTSAEKKLSGSSRGEQ